MSNSVVFSHWKLRFPSHRKYGVSEGEKISLIYASNNNNNFNHARYFVGPALPPFVDSELYCAGYQPFRTGSVAPDQCSYCGVTGHWKRFCYKFQAEKGQRSFVAAKYGATSGAATPSTSAAVTGQ